MFTPSHTGQLRGHSEKIFKEQCRLDTRKYFFTQRVVKPWNKLSQDAVSQTKVDAFKKIIIEGCCYARSDLDIHVSPHKNYDVHSKFKNRQ